MTDRIRLTITVTPYVHDVFLRMAAASGRSLGRCMGDWLDDTSEGAQLTVMKMGELRAAPARAQAEFLRAAADAKSLDALIEEQSQRAAPAAEPLARRVGSAAHAPSSNTGLKVGRRGVRDGQKS